MSPSSPDGVGRPDEGSRQREDRIGSLALGCYDIVPEEAERQGRHQSRTDIIATGVT